MVIIAIFKIFKISAIFAMVTIVMIVAIVTIVMIVAVVTLDNSIANLFTFFRQSLDERFFAKTSCDFLNKSR